MNPTISEKEKNLGAAIHLSTFLKYFFPLANFFAPLIIWTLHKEKPFLDAQGKNALNFQLSVFVYTLCIGLLCLPFFVFFASDFLGLINEIDQTINTIGFQELKNLSGYFILFGIVVLLLFGLFILELYAVITATMYAAKGNTYAYPLCIPFIRTSEIVSETNQPNHEHLS